MGDANLCSLKWNNSKFLNRNIAAPLRISLDRCGLLCNDIGITYQSDHTLANGAVPESALDHGHCSVKPINKTTTTTIYTSRAVTMTHILFLITCTQ